MWTLCGGDLSRVDGRTAFEAMRRGDAAAKGVVDQYLSYLADGLANFVNIFQPEVIALGGGVSHERDEDLLAAPAVPGAGPVLRPGGPAPPQDREGQAGQRRRHHRRGPAGAPPPDR